MRRRSVSARPGAVFRCRPEQLLRGKVYARPEKRSYEVRDFTFRELASTASRLVLEARNPGVRLRGHARLHRFRRPAFRQDRPVQAHRNPLGIVPAAGTFPAAGAARNGARRGGRMAAPRLHRRAGRTRQTHDGLPGPATVSTWISRSGKSSTSSTPSAS